MRRTSHETANSISESPRTVWMRSAIAALLGMVCVSAMAGSSLSQTPGPRKPIIATGAEMLAASRFAAVAGKRVGLVTNHTGRVGGEHLADLLSKAPNVKLTAIFAPEHGFRGTAEAGAKVGDGVDAKTGVAVFSLYGASKKPGRRGCCATWMSWFSIFRISALASYTYISTMGLAMQAAAAARIPFVVLDRPNSRAATTSPDLS